MEIVASEWKHFAFWNFLEFFFNIFNPWLVESVDVEPMDMWANCITQNLNKSLK